MKRNNNILLSDQNNYSVKMIHKGVYMTTKICTTCNIVRPFRASHCKDCDNCIERLDHHCPWLGGCIGKKNYIYFYFFLLFLVISNFSILLLTFSHFFKEFNFNSFYQDLIELNFQKLIPDLYQIFSYKKILNFLPTIFTFFYLIIIKFFTVGLFFNHTKFIFRNITTREEIKKLVHGKIGNPYNKGLIKNCGDFFCRKKKSAELNVLKQLKEKIKIERKTMSLAPKMKKKIMPILTESSIQSDNDKNSKKSESEDDNNENDKDDNEGVKFIKKEQEKEDEEEDNSDDVCESNEEEEDESQNLNISELIRERYKRKLKKKNKFLRNSLSKKGIVDLEVDINGRKRRFTSNDSSDKDSKIKINTSRNSKDMLNINIDNNSIFNQTFN